MSSTESATPSELPNPYGSRPESPADAPRSAPPVAPPRTKVRVTHLQKAKDQGTKFAMLTSYDQYTAQIFDEAGIEVLLVGDSAGNNVFGYETTLPVTVDELLPLCRAVASAAQRALIVVDLPFGSYEASPEQAVHTAVRFLKEGRAAAVKLEGDARMAPQVCALTAAGIPVMAHIGFTPQSEHALGGYRVQGRGDAAEDLLNDARALAEAGAFCVLMEMVPAEVAARVDADLDVPTIGIGAGSATTGQVLVWTDMAGMREGKLPRFVKQFAQLRGELLSAASSFRTEVHQGSFPGPEHSF